MIYSGAAPGCQHITAAAAGLAGPIAIHVSLYRRHLVARTIAADDLDSQGGQSGTRLNQISVAASRSTGLDASKPDNYHRQRCSY